MLGYGLAVVIGITIGLAMGYYRLLYNLFEPLVEALRPIPGPAYLPILVLLAHPHVQRVMDAFQGAVRVPELEIVVHRARRRQILRQRLPMATCPTVRRHAKSEASCHKRSPDRPVLPIGRTSSCVPLSRAVAEPELTDAVVPPELERARKVDAKLREILRWGIPEPGGAGGGKGLPSSFLGTALLSTQADVTSVLSQSLSDDPTGTGKERIAAALQAVAQDPLFAALLRETQVRRDQAYTERGAKKTARGSVFKDAADRVNETRNEKERLQKLVDNSESVEKELRKLMATRIQREEALASAAEHVKIVEQLASQAAALSAAAEQVRIAREEVERIRGIDREIAAAEHNLEDLAVKVAQAEEAVKAAQRQVTQTETTWEAAKKAATSDGTDSGTRHTFARQGLLCWDSRAAFNFVPPVPRGVLGNDGRARRSACSERCRAEGLVPSPSRGKGACVSDHRVYVPAGRLRLSERNAVRDGRSQGYGWRFYPRNGS